ncbi:T9SS type A sorting domain-containing protein [candidate division KSB1 bacterium]|nr:T9SS type A sorting domain-containing protein [candidate division KSB1 bacterium]
MKKKILFTSVVILIAVSLSMGQIVETNSLSQERGYEVILIDTVGHVFDVDSILTSPDEVKVYAYHSNSGWVPMPFQIDESDPYDTPDATFEYDDKLMFLAQDLGDRATEDNWVDDAEARANLKRYELEVIDSIDPTEKGWCYIYKSSTLEKSPTKYIEYDPDKDIVNGKYYQVDYLKKWYPANMKVTIEGGGNNTDFYERTKLRFGLNFGGFPAVITENKLLTQSIKFSQNATIRLRRLIFLAIDVESDTLKEEDPVQFTMTHYPYSFVFSSDSIDTRDLYDYVAKIKIIRMSYDLDSTAIGMKFYHGDSSGIKDAERNIIVDGQNGLDNVDTTLAENKPNWTFMTSMVGSFLTVNDVHFKKRETSEYPYYQYLYYWDNAIKRGTILPNTSYDLETGDSLSYGDHGMFFQSDALQGFFNYKSTSFLLPADQTAEAAQQIFYNVHSPLGRAVRLQTYSTDVADAGNDGKPYTYKLYSNYPNPFNPATTISFDIAKQENVVLNIYNIQGKHVATLVDGELNAGNHTVKWNGTDNFGTSLSSGIYVYTLKTESFNASRKMLFIK